MIKTNKILSPDAEERQANERSKGENPIIMANLVFLKIKVHIEGTHQALLILTTLLKLLIYKLIQLNLF